VNREAVCNDGTPAAYYFRPGYGSGASSWVIRLQGGGWCWDEESCKTRAVKYTTSNVCPPNITDFDTIQGSADNGILSSLVALNPYFYNANHVWLWYCTSDSHIGNKTANASLNGWYFMGKTVVQTLIYHLLYVQKPSLLAANQILLTGDSAGGVATLNNADFVWSLISSVLPNVHYRAFVDAGWFLDIPAYNSTFSFQMVAKNLFNYWGAIYDESCTQYYGPGNEWHCFHAQYAWPHLTTPTFYQEFQFDAANLGFDGIGTYPFSPSEQTFANAFQQSMLNDTAKAPYFFLPNCFKHETIDSYYFAGISIGGVSIADALWNWFQPFQNPLPYHTTDLCIPINCNPTCPPL